MPDSPSTSPWVQLRHQMAQAFNKSELKTLCFDLNLDEGELEPGNKIQKITSLITLMERRGRLAELLSTLAAARPHLSWPTLELLQATKNELAYTTTGTPIKRGRDERNRHTMLLKVKNFWIDGVLAHSLHSQIIPLDLERNPTAITRPRLMDVIWQPQNHSPQLLPSGTKLITLFNHAAGDALLILGDPGSGKTILLLELTRDLLTEAEQDESLRIPVVFNLSTWATHQLPLTEWLITELQTLYLISKQTAQAWIEQDDILPLLDGLDEVAPQHRAACIQAINIYRQSKGIPLVVCSRIADYEAIGTKLHLSDALLLKPLTPTQINDYLASGGRALDTVRHAIQQDTVLQEMAQSPLLLSIMAITYRDQPLHHFTTTNPDDRRRQLFDAYIQRQLPQRRRDEREDPATTLHQLTYLAHQMTARNQTLFLIERLQPTWLPTRSQQRLYRWTAGLAFGLFGGLAFGLFGRLFGGLVDELAFGLFGGLFGGLGFGRLVDESRNIEPVENLSQPLRHILRDSLVLGLAFGLVGGLVGGLVLGLFGGLAWGLAAGLTSGLVIGLGFGLTSLLTFVLNSRPAVGLVKLRTTPNEGIKNSAQNAIWVGLTVWLSVELAFGLAFGLFGSLFGVLPLRVALGLALGLAGGLKNGGGAVIQHYTLRFYLHRYSYLPLRSLVPFLDLAAERLILQKVGGGYRFIHRTLQDHLATLYTPPPPSESPSPPGRGPG